MGSSGSRKPSGRKLLMKSRESEPEPDQQDPQSCCWWLINLNPRGPLCWRSEISTMSRRHFRTAQSTRCNKPRTSGRESLAIGNEAARRLPRSQGPRSCSCSQKEPPSEPACVLIFCLNPLNSRQSAINFLPESAEHSAPQ